MYSSGQEQGRQKKQDNSTIVPRVEQIEQLLVRNVGSVMQPLHQLLEPTPDEVSIDKCCIDYWLSLARKDWLSRSMVGLDLWYSLAKAWILLVGNLALCLFFSM